MVGSKKADLIPFVGEQSLVIAADTLVIHDRRILGKPQDAKEARDMLKSLSGTSHQVITGVCLRRTHERTVFSESTEVHFSVLSEDEIDHYIQQYKPYDKAGAYGIQEWIGLRFVHKIVGSYTNVVGLPTERLYSELKKSHPQAQGIRYRMMDQIRKEDGSNPKGRWIKSERLMDQIRKEEKPKLRLLHRHARKCLLNRP